MSRSYDLFAGAFEKRLRNKALARLSIASGEVVLEIGFGTGHCLKQIAEEVIDWVEEHEELEEVVKGMILEEGCPPGKYYNAETFERLEKERRQ